jgi:hypothetical protein
VRGCGNVNGQELGGGARRGLIFGGARLPNGLRILTELLSLLNSRVTLDRCACRAAGLPRCKSSGFRAAPGEASFNMANEHTIDPGSASVLV